MRARIYISKEALALLTKDEDYYRLGEVFFDGGVRPLTFNSRKDASKYIRKSKYVFYGYYKIGVKPNA